MNQDDIPKRLRVDPNQGDLVLFINHRTNQAIVARFRRHLPSDTVPNDGGFKIISPMLRKTKKHENTYKNTYRALYSIEVYDAVVLYPRSAGKLLPYDVRGFDTDYAYSGDTPVRSVLKNAGPLAHHIDSLDELVPEISNLEAGPIDQ